MKNDANTHRAHWRLAWWWPSAVALSLGFASAGHAEPALPIGVTRIAGLAAPPVQVRQDRDELVIMVCRRGLASTLEGMMQERQVHQHLPLLCLPTVADQEAKKMGPARFHELLDKAAEHGLLHGVVIQRQ